MSHYLQRSQQLSDCAKVIPTQTKTLDSLSSSLSDTLKVGAFLIATFACRYYLTGELSNPTDGASERAVDASLTHPTPPLNLMDLSTVKL